ncbi:MAG: adenylate/guanylate cyclase domain-containing protein [Deltaproteobacteria bacterium]|nr:adenylate/guanylate cyclase domain-containing protein [Deltaproteobacteria bacterium]
MRYHLVALLITGFFVAISYVHEVNPGWSPLVASLADKSLDTKFLLRGPLPRKAHVVIVAADEKSFQRFGAMPWDRGDVVAPFIEALCRLPIRTLSLDAVWTDREKLLTERLQRVVKGMLGRRAGELDARLAENSGDALLRKAFETCGSRLVLGYALQLEEEGVPRAMFEERLAILTKPDAGNVLQAETPPGARFARRRGDPKADIPFHWLGRSGVLATPESTPEDSAQGFLNAEPDNDGHFHHAQLLFRVGAPAGGTGERFVSSLALRTAQKLLDAADSPPRLSVGANLRLDLATPTGRRAVPVDPFGSALINYRGPSYTYPNVSMADVLDPAETIDYDLVDATGRVVLRKISKASLFKDAIVYFGFTAQAGHDILARPFAPAGSGVEIQANMLDNLLNDDFLVLPTRGQFLAALLAALVVGALFGWLIVRLSALWGALCAVLAIGGTLYADQVWLFNQRHLLFFGPLHAAQLAAIYLVITALRFRHEEREKRGIRAAFDKYVSPAVIDTMLKDPSRLRLGGEKKTLSVLFSDIRGFTSLSERLEVTQLTHLLNEYLGAMTDILQDNKGTLDKYIGDAVMGFWGAPLDLPDHAMLAVKTATEMADRLESLNAGFRQRYGVELEIGVGVNSGTASVGNFGSNRVFEYTVIGDNVNLASRLEGVNKRYGTRILVSQATHELLVPGAFLSREIDRVKVKGRQQAVAIYEVLSDTPANAPLKAAIGAYNEALTRYYARDWAAAAARFEDVLRSRPSDIPTTEMLERCHVFAKRPPPDDWDGSFEMDSK